jgi:hypothetical protein
MRKERFTITVKASTAAADAERPKAKRRSLRRAYSTGSIVDTGDDKARAKRQARREAAKLKARIEAANARERARKEKARIKAMADAQRRAEALRLAKAIAKAENAERRRQQELAERTRLYAEAQQLMDSVPALRKLRDEFVQGRSGDDPG